MGVTASSIVLTYVHEIRAGKLTVGYTYRTLCEEFRQKMYYMGDN